jgi:hypothetical protein
MNFDHDTELERAIHRELKDLPELTAPESLIGRVASALERRSAAPWYRRSWPTWPVALQAASLALLVILFAGICLAGWQLSQTAACRIAVSGAGEVISRLSLIANTFEALTGAAVLVIQKLGTGFLVVCLFAAGLAYALCVGLSTVYLRLAFVKR